MLASAKFGTIRSIPFRILAKITLMAACLAFSMALFLAPDMGWSLKNCSAIDRAGRSSHWKWGRSSLDSSVFLMYGLGLWAIFFLLPTLTGVLGLFMLSVRPVDIDDDDIDFTSDTHRCGSNPYIRGPVADP